MKTFEEIKEKLMKEYPKYFEVLNLDFQARCFMYKPEDVDYKKELDKNIRNMLDCERTLAENKALRDYKSNKEEYERHLKIFKEIMEEK